MIRLSLSILLIQMISYSALAQEYIPFDTAHWDFQTNGHVVENFHGKDAIYINQGMAVLKDTTFINGTIEFDIFLTERRSFPGVRFRVNGDHSESFYFRTTQSGKPDANQATPEFNGISAWQLYFGPSYSFVYDYPFDRWMHVKLAIKDQQAQIYLDGVEKSNLSWELKQKAIPGPVLLGGSFAAMHYANVQISHTAPDLVNYNPLKKEPIDGLINEWNVSDQFDEKLLEDIENVKSLIAQRSWPHKVSVDDSHVANLSRVAKSPSQSTNTVMAKVTVHSETDQIKLFQFGYSDRVIAFCNGIPVYRGTNQYRSRDFRYLGTVGLFDSIYVSLKEGDNELIFAVSETFGGWGITGKFEDFEGLTLVR